MTRSGKEQTPEVKHYAKQVRTWRRHNPKATWEMTAQEFGIINENKGLSPGLAHLIVADGYMPGPEVCKRLGLHLKSCPVCGQKIRTPKPGYIDRAVKFLKEREQ